MFLSYAVMPAFVFIVLLNDYKTYQCFKCDTDSDGFQQFYTNEKCEIHCKNKSNVCVCDGACVKCLPHSKAKGLDGCQQMPKDKADGNCASVPYNGKPNEGPDTKGSDSKKTPKGRNVDTGSSDTKTPGGSGGKYGGSTDIGLSGDNPTLTMFGSLSHGKQNQITDPDQMFKPV